MSDKLKPCPFCGGEAIIKINAQTLNCCTVCPECNVTMKRNFKGNKRIEELLVHLMAEAWNRRTE